VIYFDSASTSIFKPDAVIEAITEAMANLGNPGRGAHSAALAATRQVYKARESIASFFGASPGRVAFAHNATTALNIAIFGLLCPGDHVITTTLEHNSVLRPLHQLQKRGLSVDFVSLLPNGDLDYEKFEGLVNTNTKCIIATHCSNVTGQIINIEYLARLCDKYGLILIVDAAQSAGLVPIDIRQLGRCVVCFTGHKGLLGSQGTGGLIVNDVEISPIIVGGSGTNSFSALHPADFPESLEAGTLNVHGIAGLAAGVQWVKHKGVDALRDEGLKLSDAFMHAIRGINGIKILGNPELNKVPIVCVNIGGLDSKQAETILAEHEICTRGGFHCAPLTHKALGTQSQGAVRFSFSSANTLAQVQTAIACISQIAKEFV